VKRLILHPFVESFFNGEVPFVWSENPFGQFLESLSLNVACFVEASRLGGDFLTLAREWIPECVVPNLPSPVQAVAVTTLITLLH
jgi:hypothetical protein